MAETTLNEILSFAMLFNGAVIKRCEEDAAFKRDFVRCVRPEELARLKALSPEINGNDELRTQVEIAEIQMRAIRRMPRPEAGRLLRRIFAGALARATSPEAPLDLQGLRQKLETLNAPCLAAQVGAATGAVN
jgi:hypothetical protein